MIRWQQISLLLCVALWATTALSDEIEYNMNERLSILEQKYSKRRAMILSEYEELYKAKVVQATKRGDLDMALKYRNKHRSIRREVVALQRKSGAYPIPQEIHLLRLTFEDPVDGRLLRNEVNQKPIRVYGAKRVKDKERGWVMSFDGSGDQLDCGSGREFDLSSNFTFAMWVKADRFRPYAGLISKYQRTNAYTLRQGSGTHYELGSFANLTPTRNNLKVGKWYHLVGRVSNNQISIFIDGVKHGESSGRKVIPKNNESVKIGVCYRDRYFSGRMDNVHIFNGALSDKEIRRLYETEK